jgi:hypothetical protein
MIDDLDECVQRIAEAGRQDVVARLHDALIGQATAAGMTLAPDELDRLATDAVAHADGVLWRRALAGAASDRLGISLGEAIDHPAVLEAHHRVGAPPFQPAADLREESGAAEADALRIAAVHLGGIEALRVGERDLELRLSGAGLDVLKRSSGAPIGRLAWRDIESISVPRGRRGLRPRGRRALQLHLATDRGRASFELPWLTEEQLGAHLEPMLARTRGRRDGGVG